MSKEAVEQFVTQIADSEELRTQIEGQLDSDGEMSMDELIELGAAYGCDFSVDDLNEAAELSDEELNCVAGGTNSDAKKQSFSNGPSVSSQSDIGIVDGYGDGTAEPEPFINRAKWLMARIRPSRIG